MAAKSLLLRPNVAALCLAGSRTFLRRTLSLVVISASPASYNLSSSRLLFSSRLPRSSSTSQIRRGFCVRATENPGPIESPLMESMEKKLFTAIRGKGDFLNVKPIKVSSQGKLLTSLLAAESIISGGYIRTMQI